MAKYQYRVSTQSDWTSNYGFAFLALTNTSGSGKKITLRSLECQVSSANGGSTTLGNSTATLYKSTAPLSGEELNRHYVELDSATPKPSTVVVRRCAEVGTLSTPIKTISLSRRSAAAGTQNIPLWCGMQFGFKGKAGGFRSAYDGGTGTVEPLFVRNGESYVLMTDEDVDFGFTSPVRVNITASINGKTVVWNFVSLILPGYAIFSIENTSTDVVELLQYSFAELGTNDTPTIRVVPIGQMYADDIDDLSKQQVSVTKMDSAYPDLASSTFVAYSDVGFIPSGVPEVYFNEGSAGTPKGLNYLHTRDFQGPTVRNFLPEMCHMKQNAQPDMLGLSYSLKWSDLLVRKSGITINPGEGIALVSSAETAVAVTTAFSGWPTLTFYATIDVEPYQIPTIAISGMVVGSRYRVELASDGSEVFGGITADGTASYVYSVFDTDVNMVLKVRKSSEEPFYKPVQVSFTLTSAGITIPVSQQLDS